MVPIARQRPVLFWSGCVAGVLLLGYAALGYMYVPHLVKQQAQQWVRTNYKRELKVERVRVNPFRLRLEFKGVALPDADGTPMIGFSRLLVDAELASLWRRKLVMREINLDAPRLRAVRRADGRFNLADLALPATKPAPTPAQPSPLHSLWLGALAVTAGEIQYVDVAQPAAPLRLASLAVTARALGKDLAGPLEVKLDTRLNDLGSVHIGGELTAMPLAASLQVDVKELPLEPLRPHALPQAALTLRSGSLTTLGQLVIASVAGAPPTVKYEGDVHLDSLHTVDNLLQQDLLKFRRLTLEKLRYTSAPAQLVILRVALQEPYARLVISPQKVTNLGAVFAPAGAPKTGTAPAAAATPAAAVAPAVSAASAPPMQVQVGEVVVQDGRLSFADLNIQPNFAAEITGLAGRVAPVSTARDTRATVALAGKVGEFSPVMIEGTVQPFAFDRYTSIRMKFSNIALPVFNPYSGVFAGFNIAKGKLDTQLSYEITDRRLKAGHHVRIDQLEWGEASKYKGEATLPVKFATVLLRDRHGVIDLNLPVSGSLDDPKFRIGPLVWQILRNIIVKAATAPFALLGSLFAGAEEAQFVSFPPGVAVLEPAAGTRLAALAKGLAEREGLAVDIPLGVIEELDRPALLEQRVRSLLLEQRLPADQLAAEEQRLRSSIVVSDADLEQLAQARSDAVQRALLGAGDLQASRVFIVRDGKVKAQDGQVQMQLDLK